MFGCEAMAQAVSLTSDCRSAGFSNHPHRWGGDLVLGAGGGESHRVRGSGAHRDLVQKGDAPPVERGYPGTEFCVDIVVKGRKTEVPERFRKHVAEKLEKIQKFDGKVISLDVEVSKERNPRQADRCERVEITLRSRGPVIRAEACAGDPYAALDMAAARLDAQLRKAADRRRVHKGGTGGRTPISVAAATAGLAAPQAAAPEREEPQSSAVKTRIGSLEVEGEGPLVVREKVHAA